MRLWHQTLIPYLPNKQLLGQHRECCALRGKGWGRKHSIVDYVFRYPIELLVAYHQVVMDEMLFHDWNIDWSWKSAKYRGKNILKDESINPGLALSIQIESRQGFMIYQEHDKEYLIECLDNLKSKGIFLDRKEVLTNYEKHAKHMI